MTAVLYVLKAAIWIWRFDAMYKQSMNVVKGVGNAVKTGYDAYQGYYQWDKEFELQKQQYADSLQRTQLSDQISAKINKHSS